MTPNDNISNSGPTNFMTTQNKSTMPTNMAEAIEERAPKLRCGGSDSAWIPVTEKMPPIGADVLTWGKSLPGYGPDVSRVYRGPNNSPDFGDGWRTGQTFAVTHWAYIKPPNNPNLPKNGKNGE